MPAQVRKSPSNSSFRMPSLLKPMMLLGLILSGKVFASRSMNFAMFSPSEKTEALAEMGTVEAVNNCIDYSIASGACKVLAALPAGYGGEELSSDCANRQMFFNKMTPAQQAACNKKMDLGDPYLQVATSPTFDNAQIIPLGGRKGR